MRSVKKCTMLLGIVAVGSIVVSAACAQSSSEAARAVVERTKTTSSTYTLYLWNRVTIPGEPVLEEGSAEFHKGDLHRFETPRDRIIADCRAQLVLICLLSQARLSKDQKWLLLPAVLTRIFLSNP